MGKEHRGCVKGFHWYSRHWHSKGQPTDSRIKDRLCIGFYPKEGGTTGEFMIEWEDIGPYVAPRLKAFDDSWHALSQMPELLQLMANWDGEHKRPEELSKALVDLGFTDLTETAAPEPFPSPFPIEGETKQ